MSDELNARVRMSMRPAAVITVPIDTTLSAAGQAADAKAVGDALAQKADASSVVRTKVNDEEADNQGLVLLDAGGIPMETGGAETVKAAVEAIKGWTAADIPMEAGSTGSVKAAVEAAAARTGADIPVDGTEDAKTIAQALSESANLTGATLAMSDTDADKVADRIIALEEGTEGAVKSVNGRTADENGAVELQDVPYAGNLRSTSSRNSNSTFLIRTTGGESSVDDGSQGTLMAILGGRVREGYVAPVINLSVNQAAREEEEDTIIVTHNEETFIENASGGTITVSYTDAWSAIPAPAGGADPLAFYGLTVLGTPKSGDTIIIQYTEAILGTIRQSSPTSFVSTGWNLFNYAMGYARVTRYSEERGYMISGARTGLKFSATAAGAKTTITPDAAGRFQVPGDGYVFVEGGNNTDTAIWATWDDWTGGNPGYEAYSESVIDISEIMTNFFPYGLMQVGDYRDEINLATGMAVQMIARMDNDAAGENLAAAKASGRAYEYDGNYIYIVRASSSQYEIALDGGYAVSDHGVEYFTGTSVPAGLRAVYGANLKNKLERDVLTISAQELSDAQKEQVRENIGAAPASLAETLSQVINGLFKIVTYKFTITATSANSYKSITAEELGITAIEGYKLVAFAEVYCGNHYLVISRISPAMTGSVVTVHNTSSSSVSAKTVTVTALWVKESAVAV